MTARARSRELASAVVRSRRPVLLVDHRDFAREPVARALRDAGFVPMTAPTAHRALELLRNREIRVDAVLVPLELGGREARGFEARASATRPDVPVVLLAAGAPDAGGREGLRASEGEPAPILRGDSPEQLGARLEEILAPHSTSAALAWEPHDGSAPTRPGAGCLRSPSADRGGRLQRR